MRRRRGKVGRLLHKLDYLPRWAWYALSFFIGGPFGIIALLIAFQVLERIAQEEDEEQLEWDMDRGAYGAGTGTYADDDCVVTDDEQVEREWRRAQESARSAQQARQEQPRAGRQQAPKREEAPEPEINTGDVDDVIRAGQEALRRIRHADDVIADAQLSAQIVSIENSCRQILSILEQRPQILPQLRTFLRYYLPTTLKLLDARSKLENNANTPKAREISQRIAEAIGAIDKAFQKQVEALDEYRFIDLESEMDVLRDMLKADGLAGDDSDAQDDPFADVMNARKKGKGGQVPMAGH